MALPLYKLFINGEFVDTSAYDTLIDPSSGEKIALACLGDKTHIESSIACARYSYDKVLTTMPLNERKECLLKISRGILEKAQIFAQLETLNTGKPIKESTFMDVPSAAKTFEYFANNLENFLQPESRDASPDCDCSLIRQGIGVVALIVPWNYPLIIASWKLAQAIAAGNSVILKPSTQTPLTALELASIINDCGLPKGTVNIVNAHSDIIGPLICDDKRIDMISFTGSNQAGKKIIEASGRRIKKLVMELGGKSAGIVFNDADIELAVNGSLCSIYLNQGQMCTAMSRLFVQKEIFAGFLRDFVEKTKKIKLGKGMDYQTQMGPLISQEQLYKVAAYVEAAKSQGIECACGGGPSKDQDLKRGFFYEPTVFVNPSADSPVFKEEIFGPVVCISSFEEKEEVIDKANAGDFALACCLWTKDVPFAREIAAKINVGAIWINTYGMFYDALPYGGFKASGFGKELGKEGFNEYTRLKSLINARVTDSVKPLVNYWYGL